jgi:hypothetical protein
MDFYENLCREVKTLATHSIVKSGPQKCIVHMPQGVFMHAF